MRITPLPNDKELLKLLRENAFNLGYLFAKNRNYDNIADYYERERNYGDYIEYIVKNLGNRKYQFYIDLKEVIELNLPKPPRPPLDRNI